MNRKRTAGFLLTISVFCIMCGLLLSPKLLWGTRVTDGYAVTFPEALQHIGESAFSNTAIGSAHFNDGLVSIGANAFKDVGRMKDAYIPDSTVYIAKEAFPLTTVIHGSVNSYVRSWAEANGYRFSVSFLDVLKMLSDSVSLKSLFILLFLFVLSEDHKILLIEKYAWHSVKSMRVKDRPELYPINYRFP